MPLTTSFIATRNEYFVATRRNDKAFGFAARRSRGKSRLESENEAVRSHEGTFYCRRVSIKVQYKRTGRARGGEGDKERERERKRENELSTKRFKTIAS